MPPFSIDTSQCWRSESRLKIGDVPLADISGIPIRMEKRKKKKIDLNYGM